MFLNVTFAVASRVNIRNPLELYSHLKFLNGSGTKSRWTLLPVFPDHRRETMRSLSSSIGSPRLLTLYQSRRRSLLLSWQNCISQKLCRSTVFRWRSVLIVAAFSPLDIGGVSKNLWGLFCTSAPLITPSRKAKLNELNKFLKTCFECALFPSVRSGRNLSRWPNSRITIATTLV